jgi:hypothetical protein
MPTLDPPTVPSLRAVAPAEGTERADTDQDITTDVQVPEIPRAPVPPPTVAVADPSGAIDVDFSDDEGTTDDAPVSTDSDPLLRLDSQVGLKPRAGTPAGVVAPAPSEPAEASGIERRHFVPTLGDTSTQSTLARIAVRQIAHESGIRPIIDVAPLRAQGPEELARAVRRAETRDRVGELIVEALGELPGAPLDAAAIFVVRPPLAIGWKGFCEDGNPVIESLAVPLDQPGLLADAYQAQRATVCSPTAVTVIDERMWSLLGGRPPNHVLVAPIAVGDQVVCILYCHSRVGLGPAEALAITLADAAATAFGRLLRAAQR